MGSYKFLEDVAVADCGVEVEGQDLNDLFETAASALAELMVTPGTVPTTLGRSATVTALSLDLLLYDWLSELIFRKDLDGEVFTRTEVSISGSGPCQLIARLQGGVIDREHTALGSDPKAVTFHQFALESVDGAWRARFIIDI